MKHPITVSILGTLPPIRALSSYCFELANVMATQCRVEFLSFKKIYPAFLYPGGTPDDDNTYPDVSTTQIKERKGLTWYNPLSWLSEGLTAKGDLLHAQWWSAPLFPIYFWVCACFKLKRKPVIFTVHNVLSHENSTLFFMMSKLLFRLGDYFIVHSGINKRQMTDFYHIPQDKIEVIPHGSLDFHVKKGVVSENLRKKMGINSKDKIILLFGAIRPYKGVDTAIKAFSEVVQTVPEARLLIAGRLWEDWQPYDQLIKKLEIEKYVITSLDYIPSGDVYRFFEVSDVCIFPYHHFESQSGAGSAAISFRKPMIVSNVGGLPDLVKDPQWIVPPKDPVSLAKTVIRCLQNPDLIAQMKSDAEIMSKKFAWSEIADKTVSIYKKLLNE